MWRELNKIFVITSKQGVITELSRPNFDVKDRIRVAYNLKHFFPKLDKNLYFELLNFPL